MKKSNQILVILVLPMMMLSFNVFPFIKKDANATKSYPRCTPTPYNSYAVKTDRKEKVLPQFVGGQEAMFKYLIENLKSPKGPDGKTIEGKVFVHFVVDKYGEVKDAKIAKGKNEALNQEALRVINLMPNWVPGTIDGKPVSMEITIPIQYLDN